MFSCSVERQDDANLIDIWQLMLWVFPVILELKMQDFATLANLSNLFHKGFVLSNLIAS